MNILIMAVWFLILNITNLNAQELPITDFSLYHIAGTENFVCETCHLQKGTLIIKINTNSHSLNINEYVQINRHTFSEKVKPRCTNCHFNSDFSPDELKNFLYGKLGDRVCYACHPEKKGRNNDELSIGDQTDNPFLQELKSQWLSKRGKVKTYRDKMHLDN